jgi:sphingosine kinase
LLFRCQNDGNDFVLLRCFLGLRKYRGRLSYLPVDKSIARSTSYHGASSSKQESGLQEPFQRSVSLYNHSSGEPIGVLTQGVGAADDKKSSVIHEGDANKPTAGTSSSSLLPPLSSPVPPEWTTIEDDFILVIAMYQTHVAQDSIGAPDSRLNDGTIFLAFTRATVSRVQLLKLFTAMQDGKPIDDPSTQIIRVRAFRLEPLGGPGGNLGRMTVDGELVDCGPIQAEVLPSLARVMTLVKE